MRRTAPSAGGTIGRREFLGRSAAAVGAGVAASVAAPLIVPASALGRDGAVAPSARIGMGFIGIGRMGQGHLRCFTGYPDAQIIAVCDVDSWRRQNAKETVEKAYVEARAGGKYAGCGAHNDLREMLARKDIDAVLIATGDRWHVPAGILAAKAGKDIYCEKPMSLTIREARAMIEMVRKQGRVFQVGLQQRSTAEFRKAVELVGAGKIGKVKHIYINFPGVSSDVTLPEEPVPEGLDWDLWLGPAPKRPFNHRFHEYGQPKNVIPWYFCRDFSGGNLTSNAVHAFDVVQWALGTDGSGPVEIIPPETKAVPSLTYRYASGVILQVDWKLDPAKHFVPKGFDPATPIQNFGALYIGEEGWIHVGREGYLKSFPESIVGSAPHGKMGHPVPDHHANWLECIRTRKMPVCDVAIGGGSTIVAHLGCIAHWTGRALKWDPAKEEFLGDEEANRMRSRAMREPWKLE
jgi:predicted dehydrogenase